MKAHRLWKRVYVLPIISRIFLTINLNEKDFWPSITFVTGQEGQYKSKTSLLKIELELKKIDWAPKKS